MAGDVAREGLRARVRAMPWAVRLQLRALEAAVDATQRRDGTVNRFRFSLLVDQAPANPARPDALGVRSVDVTVDAATSVRARVYYFSAAETEAETESSTRPVIVFFHGGGFTVSSAATRPYDALCRTICRETGAVVVSVSYRLAPEHRFPAAYDDGEAALRYLATTGLPAEIPVRVDLARCVLAGDSAGANIAHHVAQRWTAAATPPSIRLAGLLLLATYFDGEERTESELALEGVAPVVNLRRSDFWWKAFLPEGADRNHPAAHVTGEAGPEPELPEAFPPAGDGCRRRARPPAGLRAAVRLLAAPEGEGGAGGGVLGGRARLLLLPGAAGHRQARRRDQGVRGEHRAGADRVKNWR